MWNWYTHKGFIQKASCTCINMVTGLNQGVGASRFKTSTTLLNVFEKIMGKIIKQS